MAQTGPAKLPTTLHIILQQAQSYIDRYYLVTQLSSPITHHVLSLIGRSASTEHIMHRLVYAIKQAADMKSPWTCENGGTRDNDGEHRDTDEARGFQGVLRDGGGIRREEEDELVNI